MDDGVVIFGYVYSFCSMFGFEEVMVCYYNVLFVRIGKNFSGGKIEIWWGFSDDNSRFGVSFFCCSRCFGVGRSCNILSLNGCN